MVTVRMEKLLRTICANGGVTLEEVIKEAEAMGIKRKYAEENLGLLASEGFIHIKGGIVTLVKQN